ncbi:MAG: imidazole glycerol phosphate synthase subunit HisH [Sulfolobales archaeon]
MRVAIIDNGFGNLGNLENYILRTLGVRAEIVKEIGGPGRYELVVLPGVGSFSALSERISGLRSQIEEHLEAGGYVLAICLGMEALFEESEEGPGKGLGIFRGRVIRIPRSSGMRTPRIGWSRLEILRKISPWTILDGAWYYYAHSYYAITTEDSVIGISRYGPLEIPSLLVKDRIVATQFHPERSGRYGDLFAEALKSYMRR